MSTTVLRWTLVVLAAAVVALVVLTGVQARKAHADLTMVADDTTTLRDQLGSGDLVAARSTTDRMQQDADAARRHTRGPGWWVAARLPLVGDDVRTVRTVADVAFQVSVRVVPRVVAIASTVDPARLRPVGGKVSLGPLRAVGPEIVSADDVLRQQAARVGAVRTEHLSTQVAAPVLQLQQQLDEARSLSDRVTRAVRLLPSMLGEDGRRTYLLMSQNNAEIRSGGGIPGAFTTVTADHGRIGVGHQSSALTLGGPGSAPLPLTAEERRIFGDDLDRYAQDVTLTPDFPRSAALISKMWQRTHGARLDGVLSVDPVALSYLLRGTGPVAVTPDGRPLTAHNAVSSLLSTVYAVLPDAHRQDDYLEHRVDVTPTSCRADRQHLHVQVRLRSRIRPGQQLPRVVTGDAAGTTRSTIRVMLLLYAPVGGTLGRVRYSGAEHPVDELSHDGRRLSAVTLDVAPGRRRTLTVDMVSAAGQREGPQVVTTPGVFDDGVGSVGAPAC